MVLHCKLHSGCCLVEETAKVYQLRLEGDSVDSEDA